jgi:hypothetical protein
LQANYNVMRFDVTHFGKMISGENGLFLRRVRTIGPLGIMPLAPQPIVVLNDLLGRG